MSKDKKEQQQQFWNLYGNKYDLTSFVDKHPGGAQILNLTKGDLDVTPMFESYHCFTDYEQIKEELEKYKIGKSEVPMTYTFNKGDFYDVVRQRVRAHFGKSKNVNHLVKINKYWVIKSIAISLAFLFFLYMGFINKNIGTLGASIYAFLCGTSIMSLGFCIFHDSSHFALFQRNFAKNDVFSKIIGAILLWHPELWMKHHAFRHHAYTGDENLDPDVLNYHPFIRKTDRVDPKKYMKFPHNLIPYITCFVLLVFPGQFIGQIIVYWFQWRKKGYVWKMSYPTEIINRKNYETVIAMLMIFIHFYRFNFIVSLVFVLSLNIAYAFAIIPDHDTKATHSNFNKDKKDWGETQVRNSGNFGNNQVKDLYNHLFGGINYQIEHHLFPSMCSVHLNKVAPIVKETCKEFNIPYVSHVSVGSAFLDFLDGVKELYIGKQKKEE